MTLFQCNSFLSCTLPITHHSKILSDLMLGFQQCDRYAAVAKQALTTQSIPKMLRIYAVKNACAVNAQIRRVLSTTELVKFYKITNSNEIALSTWTWIGSLLNRKRLIYPIFIVTASSSLYPVSMVGAKKVIKRLLMHSVGNLIAGSTGYACARCNTYPAQL